VGFRIMCYYYIHGYVLIFRLWGRNLWCELPRRLWTLHGQSIVWHQGWTLCNWLWDVVHDKYVQSIYS